MIGESALIGSPGNTAEAGMNGLNAGLEKGIQLAARQQQYAQQAAELEYHKQTLDLKQNEYLFNIMQQAMKQPGAARKLIFKQYATEYQRIKGQAVNEDTIDYLAKTEQGDQAWGEAMKAMTHMDQKNYLEFLGNIVQSGQMTVPELIKSVDDLQKFNAMVEARKASGQASIDKTNQQSANRMKEYLLKGKVAPDLVEKITAGTATPEETQGAYTTAYQNSQQGVSSGRAAESKRHNLVTEGQGERKLDIAEERNQNLKEIALKRLDQMGQRLSQNERRIVGQFQDKIIANKSIQTARDQANYADRGLELLNRPNIRWVDMNEASVEIGRLLSGSNVVTNSRADQVMFFSLKKTWDSWMTKIKNEEQGGPNEKEVAIFRDRLMRLRTNIENYHDKLLDNMATVGVKTGRVSPDAGRVVYETMKLNPSNYSQHMGSAPESDQMGPPPPAGFTQGAAPAQVQPQAAAKPQVTATGARVFDTGVLRDLYFKQFPNSNDSAFQAYVEKLKSAGFKFK